MSRRFNPAHLAGVISVDEYRAGISQSASKYGNKKCVIDGRIFDSRLEGKRYQQLMRMKQAGKISLILCQVPFWIAPGVRYVVDFLVVKQMCIGGVPLGPPTVIFEDVKGHLTPTSRTKIKTVEHLYGVHIHILTKQDIGA